MDSVEQLARFLHEKYMECPERFPNSKPWDDLTEERKRQYMFVARAVLVEFFKPLQAKIAEVPVDRQHNDVQEVRLCDLLGQDEAGSANAGQR